MSASILNEQQRAALQKAYAAYNQVLDVAAENAGAIAETYNTIADLLKALRQKAKAVVDKINSGQKPSSQELKTLQQMAKTATEAKKKELALWKEKPGADTSPYVSTLSTWLDQQQQGIGCVNDLVAQAPAPKKGGPNQEWSFFVADCVPNQLLLEEPAAPPPIIEGLDGIFTFFEILDGCYEGWKYQTKGIVPTCLWDNMDKISPYAAGFVDRGWQMASGEDIRNVIGDFDELYCAWNKIARKTQRWLNFGACSNMSEAQAQQIQEKTKTTISFVAKYATDPAFALNTNILAAIAINNYLEDLPTSKQKQYEVGGLVFDALTIVGPITLKAANGSKMIQTISQRLKDPKVSNKLLSLLKEKGFKVKGAGSLARQKAEELISSLSKIEPKITEDLTTLTKDYGGKMEGLEFRLKSVESLERKLIADGINTPMNDVLRYTTTFENGNFTKGVQDIINTLKKGGYEIVKVKNTFENGAIYKGINTNIKYPDGQTFELQFHTPKSFNVKQNVNHLLYEEYRLLDPNSTRGATVLRCTKK